MQPQALSKLGKDGSHFPQASPKTFKVTAFIRRTPLLSSVQQLLTFKPTRLSSIFRNHSVINFSTHYHHFSTNMSSARDTVIVSELRYVALINNSAKPLSITTKFATDFNLASEKDDLKYSINYAVVARDFQTHESDHQNTNYKSLIHLGKELIQQVAFKQHAFDVTMSISRGESNFNTKVTLHKKNDNGTLSSIPGIYDTIAIKNLTLDTIIGIFTFERFQKQQIMLDIDLKLDLAAIATPPDVVNLGNTISAYLEKSNFKTVEALVLNVNKLVHKIVPETEDCKVQVLKTGILDYTDVGVSTTKSKAEIVAEKDLGIVQFEESDITTDKFVIPNLNEDTKVESNTTGGQHIAYIAFGSNQGHQLTNILQAIDELESHSQIHILQTSSLYKSKPMYYLDQPDFVNGCLKVTTTLSPHDLLKHLKQIEYDSLHRVKHFDNGPRTIDLDIILYDSTIVNTPDLNIPHIRMIERSFVLVPLCELLPPDFIHPVTAEPIHNHLQQLLNDAPPTTDIQESTDLISLVPLPTKFPMHSEGERNLRFRYLEYDLVHMKTPTQLMAILNITPDSFSDGSDNNLDLSKTMAKVDEMVANKVDIIDVGGCSTRPNSKQPPLDDELQRVLPVVREIKKKYGEHVIVSIDTYRSEVAEEAIKLGADIINDISAGTFDEKMYDVIAKYGVPYIVNHTRGDIQSMTSLVNYEQTDDGEGIKLYNERKSNDDIVTSEVCKELSKLISRMYGKGIKRWQIILDPGLGFAKNLSENLSVIRNLPFFQKYKQYNSNNDEFICFDYMPILLGPSRKKFIGTITGKETAAERINGTSASITAGIGFGADIVRVHDFKEMKDVCLMGDAIYKNIH